MNIPSWTNIINIVMNHDSKEPMIVFLSRSAFEILFRVSSIVIFGLTNSSSSWIMLFLNAVCTTLANTNLIPSFVVKTGKRKYSASQLEHKFLIEQQIVTFVSRRQLTNSKTKKIDKLRMSIILNRRRTRSQHFLQNCTYTTLSN